MWKPSPDMPDVIRKKGEKIELTMPNGSQMPLQSDEILRRAQAEPPVYKGAFIKTLQPARPHRAGKRLE
jgi:hypothetical protein